MENSTFLTQISLNVDLGLEFQKTNLRIEASILEIQVWNLRKLKSE